jgi:hypothetical protein
LAGIVRNCLTVALPKFPLLTPVKIAIIKMDESIEISAHTTIQRKAVPHKLNKLSKFIPSLAGSQQIPVNKDNRKQEIYSMSF